MVRQTKMKSNLLIAVLLMLSFILAACQPQSAAPTETTTSGETESQSTTEAVVETQAVTMEEPGTAIAPEGSDQNPLPSDPVPMTFTTNDGVELQGTFYPAKTTNDPLIVLFHWARGDQNDWRAIAYWLQNRGVQVDVPADGSPWLDPSWFPEMTADFSFNVFTFTFRGCEGGCSGINSEGWRQDVEAAMTHVIGIENVDLSRVMTIGASIGGDGAAYGCHFYNSELGGCQGAFSLSPGGYLTVPYAQEVANLDGELVARPAWCLYSEGDSESATACQEATGSLYLALEYPGSLHGMDLIDPSVDPNPLDKVLEFIHQYLQCDACSV
jgi:dienelactone hydrolase